MKIQITVRYLKAFIIFRLFQALQTITSDQRQDDFQQNMSLQQTVFSFDLNSYIFFMKKYKFTLCIHYYQSGYHFSDNLNFVFFMLPLLNIPFEDQTVTFFYFFVTFTYIMLFL